jgi:RNA polymerase sigma-70 factor (ECF subfamily)
VTRTVDDRREYTDVEQVFRDVYGQAVATLVRVFGDITIAEDAVQDAFLVASEKWPQDGIPPNPAGWIITTSRNRAIDGVRRTARGRELHDQFRTDFKFRGESDTQHEDEGELVKSDRLRLIFTCCHPALRREHQIALTLRLLGGLTVDEVARSFLVTESAMAKRLVRAKYKIKAAKIPYRVPRDAELPERLQSVLTVVYLIYNTGLDDPDRAVLRSDAMRLVRALVELMPDEPEVAGLLALMLFSDSRTNARTDGGNLVLLRDQDRTNWNMALIDEGHAIVRACIRRNQPGPFQLQAAIQAVHCDAESYAETDWHQIVDLYDHLLGLMPTSVVAMNRAIAIAEIEGPEAALQELNATAPDLDAYYLMHAARATMLRQLGQYEASLTALVRAHDLAVSEPDRQFLSRQIDELADESA